MIEIAINYAENWKNNEIFEVLSNPNGGNILTRINQPKMKVLRNIYTDLFIDIDCLKIINGDYDENYLNDDTKHYYDPFIQIIFHKNTIKMLKNNLSNKSNKSIGIVSAGHAEKNILIIGYMILTISGFYCRVMMDCGINNMLHTKQALQFVEENSINIITAGMECALADIVRHISSKPCLFVPSKNSYGFGAGGEVGLLSIFHSGVSGIGIFNIENIHGACQFAMNTFKIDADLKKKNVLYLYVDELDSHQEEFNFYDYTPVNPGSFPTGLGEDLVFEGQKIDLTYCINNEKSLTEMIDRSSIVLVRTTRNATIATLIASYTKKSGKPVILISDTDINHFRSLVNSCVLGSAVVSDMDSAIELIRCLLKN